MQIVIQHFTPLSSPLSPSLAFRLSTVGHGHFYTLIFSQLYLIALLFPETWRKTSYTHWLTHGETYTPHNYLVARFAGGPTTTQSKLSCKDCHDNAERMDKKERGGWREGWKPWAFSTVMFVDSVSEDGLSASQQRKKREGELLDAIQQSS